MAVTPEMVRQLRDRTGAGVMDCKRALAETEGDIDRAATLLRVQGIAKADARQARTAAEGRIAAYIHGPGKVGVLVEVNCETDFVARTPEFQAFVKDIAMQVAAEDPKYLSRDQVPEPVLKQEREIYRAQALAEGKPEKVVDKIVEGRLGKFYQAVCLLDQSFVRDDQKTVEELRREVAAQVGEHVVIRRFVRFQLGEESR